MRSGKTVSIPFHAVLKAVLRLQSQLLVNPEPIPQDCNDPRWRWFKGCLGALDRTYIKLKVSEIDKRRFRTRKGEVATNVLGVCDGDMRFIYILPGWKGSAADGIVLRDAVGRVDGLKVQLNQSRIIMACCLLYNFIHREMPVDPMEDQIQADLDNEGEKTVETNEDVIDTIETSTEWNQWRENLALSMYNEWRGIS
ncbi:hypothetical protein ACH5RR_006552 [Cinchona calisaya]|uniref:Transposase n=1 Tax=Cinchona calisaya TaxID=153742 RepID=A0ABD3APM6_9GENT